VALSYSKEGELMIAELTREIVLKIEASPARPESEKLELGRLSKRKIVVSP